MKALNLHAVGDLRYEDVPNPKREPGEVLLKVKACGICGSDIPRIFKKGTYHFPTIPGHEFSGKIVDADNKELIGKRAAVFHVGIAQPAKLENMLSVATMTTMVPDEMAVLQNISLSRNGISYSSMTLFHSKKQQCANLQQWLYILLGKEMSGLVTL